jgi:hypothetical protein
VARQRTPDALPAPRRVHDHAQLTNVAAPADLGDDREPAAIANGSLLVTSTNRGDTACSIESKTCRQIGRSLAMRHPNGQLWRRGDVGRQDGDPVRAARKAFH